MPAGRDSPPKGMMPGKTAEKGAPERPAPLTLADGNYAGAIRRALDFLPVEVRVDRCVVVEQAGRPPRVRLSLTVLGQRGAVEIADGDRGGQEKGQAP